MKVAVLGAGSWGTALAGLLSKEGHAVSLWSFEQDLAQAINERKENHLYLPGFVLPKTLTATHSISEAVNGAEVVV